MPTLTEKNELTTPPALDDVLHVVDISDLSGSPEGTSKKIRVDNLRGIKYHLDARKMTRTQAIYTAPNSGIGTEIALLTLDPITPTKAGNVIDITFQFFGENTNVDVGFVITRNGVVLPDAEDGSSNRYSVTVPEGYDGDFATTPYRQNITFSDNDSLATASTYRIHCRGTASSSTLSFYLNRSIASAGADGQETGVSSSSLIEHII